MLFTATFNLAKAGDVGAQAMTGRYYGYGIPKRNNVEAFKWLTRAAEAGNTEAQKDLGHAFENGVWGAPKNLKKAIEWYTQAADAGDARAQWSLGYCYSKEGTLKDMAKSFEHFMIAAVAGVATAQGYISTYYRDGVGVTADAVEAAKWLTRAAEAGDAEAQYSLGESYQYGTGDDGAGKTRVVDASFAFMWYMRSAVEGDHPLAIYKIGFCYFVGCGVAVNVDEAVEWLARGANHYQLHAPARFFLATLILRGYCSNDDADAEYWYAEAIEADATAPANLCWADDFANRREFVKSYAAAVRTLSALTGRSSAGVTAFLAAAELFACVCKKCAIAMD